MKRKLKRIVSMLTRMATKFDGVAESQAEYNAIDDYEHEHRCAEHEHDILSLRPLLGAFLKPPALQVVAD